MSCSNNMAQTYVGTELKFALTITAEGFSMDDDDFSIAVTNGRNSVTIPKSGCLDDGQGNWYFTVDTTAFGPGLIWAVITARVPDNDYEDTYREEVTKVDLIYIKSL